MVRAPLVFSNPVQGRDVFTGGAMWSPHTLTPASMTLRSIALQAPLSMGFSRQEYWSDFPFPPPEDLPDPGIEPESPALTGGFLPLHTWELASNCQISFKKKKSAPLLVHSLLVTIHLLLLQNKWAPWSVAMSI